MSQAVETCVMPVRMTTCDPHTPARGGSAVQADYQITIKSKVPASVQVSVKALRTYTTAEPDLQGCRHGGASAQKTGGHSDS